MTTFADLRAKQQRRVSNTVPALWLLVLHPGSVMYTADGSYHLVLVSVWEQWTESEVSLANDCNRSVLFLVWHICVMTPIAFNNCSFSSYLLSNYLLHYVLKWLPDKLSSTFRNSFAKKIQKFLKHRPSLPYGHNKKLVCQHENKSIKD